MASTPSPALVHTPLAFERLAAATLTAVFAAGCVFYAVLAFDYFLSFASGREGLWLQLFAALVPAEYAYGPGSVHIDQVVPYRAGLDFMLMHTTMGAIAMAIGPFQFIHPLRRRYPVLHRTAGKIYLVAVVLSMGGGIAYLATTSLGAVYSGATFAVALIGLDLAVLFTAALAYRAIRRRQIARHQSWMAFNFGLLLSTPVLRVLWIVFGWSAPGLGQAQANLAITTFLLPLCVTIMLLWLAAQNRTAHLPKR